jgi:hypothetical protein
VRYKELCEQEAKDRKQYYDLVAAGIAPPLGNYEDEIRKLRAREKQLAKIIKDREAK